MSTVSLPRTQVFHCQHQRKFFVFGVTISVVEWREPQEDLSFTVRYRLNDEEGKPFGRLTAAMLSSSSAPHIAPGFQLEMTARGVPQGTGREGIAAFHDHGHRAIVRCFAALTTPEIAQALGEVPVSSPLMTLSDFEAVQLPPPAPRAPRTNLPTLLRKFTFGLGIASPATTSRTRDQETSGAQQQSLNQQPLTAFVPNRCTG